MVFVAKKRDWGDEVHFCLAFTMKNTLDWQNLNQQR